MDNTLLFRLFPVSLEGYFKLFMHLLLEMQFMVGFIWKYVQNHLSSALYPLRRNGYKSEYKLFKTILFFEPRKFCWKFRNEPRINIFTDYHQLHKYGIFVYKWKREVVPAKIIIHYINYLLFGSTTIIKFDNWLFATFIIVGKNTTILHIVFGKKV